MDDTTPSMKFAVPEDILQPLLSISNSSTLEKALELLIEASKKSNGRSDLTSKNILHSLLRLTQILSNPTTHHHFLFSSLKLIRNLCAGEVANQNSFISENGVEVILIALKSVGFVSDFENGIVRMGLQLVGNVSLAGKLHCSAIWDRFFPNEFMEIARVRTSEICDPLCMVIYTCCDGSNERVGELCSVGIQIVTEICKTGSRVGFEEDWLKLLLSRICFEESHFLSLFSELSLSSDFDTGDGVENKYTPFTTEQAFLLSTLSECLNQQLGEVSISKYFAASVLEVVKKAITIVDITSSSNSGIPIDSPSIDILGYSLAILRDICAQKEIVGRYENENSLDVVDSLISLGLLGFLLDLLRELEPPTIIKKSISKDVKGFGGPTTSGSPKVCRYKGYRRDIVAVIGNCLYRRKYAQDEIRQKNGILLLMQQCVIDEDNPFLREWGIWSMRNLLEGNEDNKKEVADLEIQGSIDMPEIAELGLRVVVDKNTRRAKLVNLA